MCHCHSPRIYSQVMIEKCADFSANFGMIYMHVVRVHQNLHSLNEACPDRLIVKVNVILIQTFATKIRLVKPEMLLFTTSTQR